MTEGIGPPAKKSKRVTILIAALVAFVLMMIVFDPVPARNSVSVGLSVATRVIGSFGLVVSGIIFSLGVYLWYNPKKSPNDTLPLTYIGFGIGAMFLSSYAYVPDKSTLILELQMVGYVVVLAIGVLMTSRVFFRYSVISGGQVKPENSNNSMGD